MKEVNQTSPNPNPDEYFKMPESEPTAEPDNKANDEKSELFTGNMDDIEVWLKYKKFLLLKENEDEERKLRGDNAIKAYKFSRNWAIFIASLIVVYGFLNDVCFKLSSTEFMFVIGSLTASILAYYLYVIKYLFYRPNNDKNKPAE